jgi:hypothetical protein
MLAISISQLLPEKNFYFLVCSPDWNLVPIEKELPESARWAIGNARRSRDLVTGISALSRLYSFSSTPTGADAPTRSSMYRKFKI